MFDPKNKKKIEIRPIDTQKWHGHKGEKSFAKPKRLQALVDGNSMSYATGLTEEDIKELKKLVPNYNLSNVYLPDVPHDFWDATITTLKLPDHKIFLNIEHPLNYIKYMVARESKFVANSPKEWEDGRWPEATHVIYDESENEDIRASKEEQFDNAIILAHSLTTDKKVELIQILGGKNMKGQSDNAIKIKLKEVITADPVLFLSQANASSESNSAKALVLRALDEGVLRKEGHKIMYMGNMLGNDEDEVAEYLMEDENQNMKLVLMGKLN